MVGRFGPKRSFHIGAPATLIRASPDKSAIEPYVNQKIVTIYG
jgi:hypothetical protein